MSHGINSSPQKNKQFIIGTEKKTCLSQHGVGAACGRGVGLRSQDAALGSNCRCRCLGKNRRTKKHGKGRVELGTTIAAVARTTPPRRPATAIATPPAHRHCLHVYRGEKRERNERWRESVRDLGFTLYRRDELPLARSQFQPTIKV